MALHNYNPGKSALHRLDARVKVGGLAWLTLWMGWSQWEGLILSTMGTTLLVRLSLLPRKAYSSTFIALGWLSIFYGVAAGWVITGGGYFWQGYWSLPGLLSAGLMVWRIGLIFLLTRLFIAVTSPVEQGLGIAFFMTPLLKISPKAGDLILLVTLTLRFIPLIIEEGKLVWKTRLLKGSWPKKFIEKSSELARLMPPLILLVLRRAEEVGENLVARGYISGKYRSISYGEWKTSDSVAVLTLAVWAGLLSMIFWHF
jgi:energy-coupling factor transport system permease protein